MLDHLTPFRVSGVFALAGSVRLLLCVNLVTFGQPSSFEPIHAALEGGRTSLSEQLLVNSLVSPVHFHKPTFRLKFVDYY